MAFKILSFAALAAFGLAYGAGSDARAVTNIVNLFDLGVVVSGAGVPLSSSDQLSCLFDQSSTSGGKLTMATILHFTPVVGTKYVLPIHEDASCNGRGLSSIVYSDKVDMGLEDVATGQAITIRRPQGCTYVQHIKGGESTGFTTSQNPSNVQLTFTPKQQWPTTEGNVAYLGWMIDQHDVDLACFYQANWPWPGN